MSVEEALKPGSFNLLEFVTGGGRPKDKVTVNPAADLAYERAKLLERLAYEYKVPKLDSVGIETIYNSAGPAELEALTAIDEALAKYNLTFFIQAVPLETQDAIRKTVFSDFEPERLAEDDPRAIFGVEKYPEEAYREFTFHLAAAAIYQAQVGDSDVFTPDQKTLPSVIKSLPESQQEKLTDAIRDLNVDGHFFESQVTPDF